NIDENNLIDFFQKITYLVPHKIAVKYDNKAINYIELDALSTNLAKLIQQRYFLIYNKNIVAGHTYVIFSGHTIEDIVSILAILKVGGVYIVLDRNHPKQYHENIIDDVTPCLLFSTPAHKLEVPSEYTKKIISFTLDELITLPLFLNQQPFHNLKHELAYLIYTSGTTGSPNGVLVAHTSIISLFNVTKQIYSFNQNDIVPLFHSLSFDFSVWEMWIALLHGGTLLLIDRETILSPELFWDKIIAEKVTILNQTPAAFYQLSSYICALPINSIADLHLRLIILGGESLQVSAI
ncbi:MAG: AMP-binding protein, partial [Gammaproteobacteria bacterium]